jgi:acetyl esterase/lipase
MEIGAVAPELRGPTRRVPRMPLGSAWGRRLTRSLMRLRPAGKLDGVQVQNVDNAEPGLRIYRPGTVRSDAALLWIHGGGMIVGAAAQDDRMCGNTARELGIVVVSVEYRLAPEHPFPAALDDCHAGWSWLQDNARQLGVSQSRVVVGGESAGGGLAASLTQRIHDAGHRQPAAQWLFYPMLDDRTAARREFDSVNHRIWNNRANRVGWRAFLGVEPGAAEVPAYAAAARRQDLTGLPPAWIGVGDIDLFYTEDHEYSERLRAAGVEVTFDVTPGAPHAFLSWATETTIAREHVHRARTWLRNTLSP